MAASFWDSTANRDNGRNRSVASVRRDCKQALASSEGLAPVPPARARLGALKGVLIDRKPVSIPGTMLGGEAAAKF